MRVRPLVPNWKEAAYQDHPRYQPLISLQWQQDPGSEAASYERCDPV